MPRSIGPKTLEMISEEIEKRLQRLGMPTERTTPFSIERIAATVLLVLTTGGGVVGTNLYNQGEVTSAQAAAQQAKLERDSARVERGEMRDRHALQMEAQRKYHQEAMNQQTESCKDFVDRCEDLCK